MDIESDMNVSYAFQDEVEDLVYNHGVNLMMVRCLFVDTSTVKSLS